MSAARRSFFNNSFWQCAVAAAPLSANQLLQIFIPQDQYLAYIRTGNYILVTGTQSFTKAVSEVKLVLGSFKARLVLVMMLIILVGYSVQTSARGRQTVEPVLRYILHKDDLVQRLSSWGTALFHTAVPVPAGSEQVLQNPCPYLGVQQNYGWRWDETRKRQVFEPGILLIVAPESPVLPSLPGRVVNICRQGDLYTVTIEHKNGLMTEYGRLRNAAVTPGVEVLRSTVLGYSSDVLYFSVHNQEGPLDPGKMFP